MDRWTVPAEDRLETGELLERAVDLARASHLSPREALWRAREGATHTEDGRCLAHSNAYLLATRVADSALEVWWETGRTQAEVVDLLCEVLFTLNMSA